jgi:hypothetical protein
MGRGTRTSTFVKYYSIELREIFLRFTVLGAPIVSNRKLVLSKVSRVEA